MLTFFVFSNLAPQNPLQNPLILIFAKEKPDESGLSTFWQALM